MDKNITQDVDFTGKDIRALIAFGDHQGEIISISRRQLFFVDALARTGDMDHAAEVAGVAVGTAQGWLRNDPKFKAFVNEKRDLIAKVSGYSLHKWASRMMDMYHGRVKFKAPMVQAGIALGRFFGYITTENSKIDKDANVELVFKFEKDGVENTVISASDAEQGGGAFLPSPDANGGQEMGKD